MWLFESPLGGASVNVDVCGYAVRTSVYNFRFMNNAENIYFLHSDSIMDKCYLQLRFPNQYELINRTVYVFPYERILFGCRENLVV